MLQHGKIEIVLKLQNAALKLKLNMKENNPIHHVFTLDTPKSCTEMNNTHEIGLNPGCISSIAMQDLSVRDIYISACIT